MRSIILALAARVAAGVDCSSWDGDRVGCSGCVASGECVFDEVTGICETVADTENCPAGDFGPTGGDECPATCFGETCDAWATKDTSCAELEDAWGCDCFGCACVVEDGDKNDDKGGDWGDDKSSTDDKDWGDKDGSQTKAPTSMWDREDDDPADDGGGDDDDDEPAKSCDVPDGCADSAAWHWGRALKAGVNDCAAVAEVPDSRCSKRGADRVRARDACPATCCNCPSAAPTTRPTPAPTKRPTKRPTKPPTPAPSPAPSSGGEGGADGWCADSGVQLCKMLCEVPDCPTGQCAMRVGTCCDAGPAATPRPTPAPSPAPTPAPTPGLAFGEFAENATTTEAFAAQCPKTCFFDTCDAWATAETTCEVLEREYDCDCAGCACDGTGSVKDDDKGGDKDGDWGDKDGYTAAPTATLTGSWRVESLGNAGGATRSYWVYAPDAAEYSGMMLFFHGAGGGASVRHAYRVAENADKYGFVGVVPVGSPGGGEDDGKGDGGKRRLEESDGTECCYYWNVDDADGVDEISFVHAVVAEVAADYAVGADKPVIALGFSNGAAMSELLGCHDSYDLWVAHVGVHYHPEANWPSTCQSKTSACPEWNAVGTEDEFLDGLSPTPTEGILAQFEAGRDAAGCPEEAARASQGGECHDYPSCPSLGVLCVYDGVIHMITDTMTESAWTYLTGPGRSCGESSTTTTKAKKDRCAKKTKRKKCTGNCVWKRGACQTEPCAAAVAGKKGKRAKNACTGTRGCSYKKKACTPCASNESKKDCKKHKKSCKWKKKKSTCKSSA